LINTLPSLNHDIENFPSIKSHLLSFGYDRLKQTGDIGARKKTNNEWFETQDSISYWDDFFKPKIIWKRIGSIIRFSYDENSICTLDSTCFATGGRHIKFLTSFLNSKMGNYLLKDAPQTGTGDLLISVQAVEPICIPMISEEENYHFCMLLDKIIENQKNDKDITILENQISKMIYTLYKFDNDEIQRIENQ